MLWVSLTSSLTWCIAGKDAAPAGDSAAGAKAKSTEAAAGSARPKVALRHGDEDEEQEMGGNGAAGNGTAATAGRVSPDAGPGPASKRARGTRNIRRTAAADDDKEDAGNSA